VLAAVGSGDKAHYMVFRTASIGGEFSWISTNLNSTYVQRRLAGFVETFAGNGLMTRMAAVTREQALSELVPSPGDGSSDKRGVWKA